MSSLAGAQGCSRSTPMRGDDGQQREQAGKRLHPENRALGGEASEDAGHDHAAQEEKLDRIGAVTAGDAPQQTGGEESWNSE